jgi:transposase
LVKRGYACDIIAPSMTPKPAGARVKTDRIDARMLAQFYKQGLLTPIHIPDEEQEGIRDLLRSRHFLNRQIVRNKHHILSLSRRLGLDYRQQTQNPNGAHWTQIHRAWLRARVNEIDIPVSKLNFQALLGHLGLLEQQLKGHDGEIRVIAEHSIYKAQLQALCCFRGIGLLSAITLAAEIGDVRRFDHPNRLTAYAGMEIIEYSSGGKERKFSMSKLGNRQIRTTVIEACQYAFRPPALSKDLRQRRQGVPLPLVQIADRCMQRLHKKSGKLHYRGKPRNKIKAACAREMLGFIWESLKTINQTA